MGMGRMNNHGAMGFLMLVSFLLGWAVRWRGTRGLDSAEVSGHSVTDMPVIGATMATPALSAKDREANRLVCVTHPTPHRLRGRERPEGGRRDGGTVGRGQRRADDGSGDGWDLEQKYPSERSRRHQRRGGKSKREIEKRQQPRAVQQKRASRRHRRTAAPFEP
ncbi:hypothetical protein J3F84DRAFT_300436 [Trichoderma pleuroticola]